MQNILMTEPIIKLDETGRMINTKIEDICNNYPYITLNERQLCDYEMIQNGGFHPLQGFMTKNEYESCINNMQLPLGSPASVPRRPVAILLHGLRKSAQILRKLASEITRLLRPPLGSGSVSDWASTSTGRRNVF